MLPDPAKFARKLHLDREQSRALLYFTWCRFLEDRCMQTAGALAYTSVFALVPLTAAVLGILAAFPVFAGWRDQITAWVFANFVPAAGDTVQSYITEFATNASKATAVGILVLFFSAVALMMSIEDAFNRIWRVQTARSHASRFIIYWTALTLGPLLLVAALAISSYVVALPFIGVAAEQLSLKTRVLSVLPFLIVWSTLAAAYIVIPNRSVRITHALLGAFIAAALFEGAKRGFAFYAVRASYQQVYGAIAIVPIFIFWIYLSWAIVLFGASLTASLSAFDYRPSSLRLQRGHEFTGLLRVLGHFAAAQRDGRGLRSEMLCAAEPFLDDDLLQRYLGDLHRAGLIQRNEAGEWVVVRDFSAVTLLEIYEEGGYRLPYETSFAPDGASPAGELLARLASEVKRGLDVPLAEIFPPAPRSDPAAAARRDVSSRDPSSMEQV
jgi:membrane protein